MSDTALRWRRGHNGLFAKDETFSYSVVRIGKRDWVLEVRRLIETAGVKHSLGEPVVARYEEGTMTILKAIAGAFSADTDHTDVRAQMRRAVDTAYAAEREQW